MNKVIKRFLILAILALFAITAAGCGSQTNTYKPAEQKIKVITTIYPVYEFAKQVGGDKIDVSMLIPPGAEPHDWEPTAKEMAQIKSAKLFLYHGAGLEPIEKLTKKETLGDTKAVEISKGLVYADTSHEDEDSHPPEIAKDHKHNHESDSHLWLDPVYAQQEVAAIAEALTSVDPQNAEYYKKNAAHFQGELSQLDQDYKTTLAGVARRDIITSHAAFGYLAKRYNLKEVSIMGLSPDAEPTPDKLAKVITFCRENNVKYIFFETLVSPKLSQTIARETNTQLLVLNPIENLTTEELKQGKNYLSIMRDNLSNLQKALQ